MFKLILLITQVNTPITPRPSHSQLACVTLIIGNHDQLVDDILFCIPTLILVILTPLHILFCSSINTIPFVFYPFQLCSIKVSFASPAQMFGFFLSVFTFLIKVHNTTKMW